MRISAGVEGLQHLNVDRGIHRDAHLEIPPPAEAPRPARDSPGRRHDKDGDGIGADRRGGTRGGVVGWRGVLVLYRKDLRKDAAVSSTRTCIPRGLTVRVRKIMLCRACSPTPLDIFRDGNMIGLACAASRHHLRRLQRHRRVAAPRHSRLPGSARAGGRRDRRAVQPRTAVGLEASEGAARRRARPRAPRGAADVLPDQPRRQSGRCSSSSARSSGSGGTS